ncbi:hypothetical protein QQ020_31475 [Fulvivirgaceae bacterium BMA12]|uniref:Uncharacterized protein n=1 Tax=Agaribacillus aureus TaxID=3051825 RepID=A0ABT8LI72_9BACT|nr:hypothetical protein [Fulvivirgaceae bacterium BMA12]
MKSKDFFLQLGLIIFIAILNSCSSKDYTSSNIEKIFSTSIEPEEGDFLVAAEFKMWIPNNAKHIRAIIVHQHGCGRNGMSIPYDRHWRALAKKWDCALLGTYFIANDSCATWANPEYGSDKAYHKALKNIAKQSGFNELTNIPWLLWGHSGGAHWASTMLSKYPQKTVAAYLRSGGKDLSKNTINVPVIIDLGAGEENHPQFGRLWSRCVTNFENARKQQAIIALAVNPETAHDCGHSRLLAIPFFDACLSQRLPGIEDKNQTLKPMDVKKAWVGNNKTFEIRPFKGGNINTLNTSILPNEKVAKIWREYVQTGWVTDKTAPEKAPYNLEAEYISNSIVKISWEADADLESGIKQFYLYRDNEKIKEFIGPNDNFNKKNFQYGNFGDEPVPEALYENVNSWIPTSLVFFDYNLNPNKKYVYQIKMVNWSNLESAISEELMVKISDINSKEYAK